MKSKQQHLEDCEQLVIDLEGMIIKELNYLKNTFGIFAENKKATLIILLNKIQEITREEQK